MAVPLQNPRFQAFTSAGALASGYLLYTYEAGTTTPLATYTDSTGDTENTNPVVLDARGEASVWADGTQLYKLVLKTALGVTVWTEDNVGFTGEGISFTASGSGAVSRTVTSKLRETRTPDDFYDNEATWDLAFSRAIAATAQGGALEVNEGTHNLTSLAPNKRLRIIGKGWHSAENSVFGSSPWNGSGVYGGTLLTFTATSGIGLEMSVAGVNPAGIGLENVMLLGPNSGTSIGLQFGHVNNEGVSEAILRNVMIAGFKTGFKAEFMIACQLHSLRIRGCDTGMTFVDDSNANGIYGGEVQFSTIDAVLLNNSRGNAFHDFLMQNAIAKGVRTVSNAYNNKFFNPWFENPGAITDVVDFASGVNCGLYGGVVSKGNVKFSDANGRLDSVYMVSNATIELTSGATGFVAINSPSSGATTNGSPSATFIDANGVSSTDIEGTTLKLSASSTNAGRVHADDSTPVSTSATTVWTAPGLSSAAEAGLVVVNGTKQGSTTIYFSDLVHFAVGVGASAVTGGTKETGSPAARTYSMSGNNLRVQMAADTYSISVAGLTVRGD